MGLLTFGINVTLDGCCDHGAAAPDDAVFRYWTRLMDGAGGMLWGRKVYELMESHWRASNLKFLDAERFKSGVVALRYKRD